MKNTPTQSRYLAGMLVVALLALPVAPVFAQEAVPENSAPQAETSAPAVGESAPPSAPNATVVYKQTPADTVDPQISSEAAPVQETVNTQEAVSGDTLESTANPETATTTESELVLIPIVEADSATTTSESSSLTVAPSEGSASEEVVIEDPVFLDVVAEVPAEEPQAPLPEESTPASESAVSNENPTPVSFAEIEPEPEYVFALSGKSIPTKKKIQREDGKVVREEAVTASSAPVVDNVQGVVNVSGSCANVYYVVLLYKKAADYDADPGSYIVNRAYPCENGKYSYAIDELPPSLSSGTYYLLVGEQGERGTWSPITGLTEIVINRN